MAAGDNVLAVRVFQPAMGAGILLSRLQSRGRAGGLVTGMLLLFYGAEALALWHYRITYAFK